MPAGAKRRHAADRQRPPPHALAGGDRLARDDDTDEAADAALERRLAPGDVERRQPAEDEREPAEQQCAPASAHGDTRRTSGSSTPIRSPCGAGAATSRPRWRSAISAAIASPRPPPPAAVARAPGEVGERDRQAGPLVGDLEAHVARPRHAGAELDPPRRVLERVGDEVRERLGEAQAVADDDRARQQAPEHHDAVERARHRLPAVELLLEQLGHLDGLLAVDDPPPAARGGEVVERQPRAAQLVVERGQALGRRLPAALHRREAQAHGGQRPAQLVAGARDHLAPASQLERAERGEREAARRERPGEDVRVHAYVQGAPEVRPPPAEPCVVGCAAGASPHSMDSDINCESEARRPGSSRGCSCSAP